MGCLLCGKEIGPIRQLRDNEFCSAAHRSRYKERLGRALSSIGQPAPPPAPLSPFITEIKPLEGNCGCAAVLVQCDPPAHAIDFGRRCPVALDPVFGSTPKPLGGAAWADRAGVAMPGTVESMFSTRLPGFAIAIAAEERRQEPPRRRKAAQNRQTALCERLPFEPSPVESWITASHAVEWMARSMPLRNRFAVETVEDWQPALCKQLPYEPSPVESWITASAAAQWIEVSIPLRNRLAVDAVEGGQRALCERLPYEPAPVESWITLSDSTQWIEGSIPLQAWFDLEAVEDWQPALCEHLPNEPVPVEAWITASHAAQWIETSIPLQAWFDMEAVDDWQPALCEHLPYEASPVESWITASDAVQWIAGSIPLRNRFALEAVEDWGPALCEHLPYEPSPVESWITASDAVEWMAPLSAPFEVRIDSPVPQLAACQPSAAPSEVMSFVTSSAALEMAASAVVRNPRFELAVCADDVAALAEEPVEVVAPCEQWMPSPAAEAVARLVTWSEASAVLSAIPVAAPHLAGLSISQTFMPASTRLARPAAAIPVAMIVRSTDVAQAIPSEPAMLRGVDLILNLALDEASHVEGPKPEPVESMPAAQVVVPAEQKIVPITAIRESALPEASCSYGNDPAGLAPEPVEDFVFPRFRATMMATPAVVLPQLTLAIAAQRLASGFERAFDAQTMPAARSLQSERKPARLEPMRALTLAQPETGSVTPAVTMPANGFLSLEFYCQRPTALLSRNPEWATPALDVMAPQFAIRPIFDKLEEAAPQKKETSKTPAMAEVFAMTKAKKKPANPATLYAFKAIAAGLVVGAILWFGMGAMRIARNAPVVNRDVSLFENNSDTAPESTSSAPATAAAPVTTVAGGTEPHGPAARLRKAIAERAAATVTDSFRNGMEAWGTTSKAWAPGWSRHPEGYVQPGQLAVFGPSLKYTDYHLEFFGQIDNKSMGWTVRSKDTQNYYAMKFSVVAPGLRPIIAMVHYPVVGGKKGKPVETPLNVMVHNNKPFQVAVDVKGNRMVTSIDGQQVDTWIDDTIPAGGVGFFADAGEKARLYWMKVSKNEDFLGRVCAYVSSKLGDGSNTSAEVWAPALPGETPIPGSRVPVRNDEAALAAAVVGFGRRRRMFGTLAGWQAGHRSSAVLGEFGCLGVEKWNS